MAVIEESILIIEYTAENVVHHIEGQGSVVLLGTEREAVLLVNQTPKPCEGEIAHHADGMGGLIHLLFTFTEHALPVALLDTLLHDEFVVEILILIPIVPDTGDKDNHQDALHAPTDKGLLPFG